MASYVMVRISVPSKSDTQINQALGLDVPTAALTGTAVTSPDAHRGVAKIIELLQGILSGSTDGTVLVAARATTQSISVDGNGISATYELK